MREEKAVEQFRNVLRGLLERARKDEVRWRFTEGKALANRATYHTEGPNALANTGTYQVRLPASAIELKFVSPDAPDRYIAALLNSANSVVQTIVADGASRDWDLLSALWSEAYRWVSGWDKALADAEAAVASENPVGGVSEKSVGEGSEESAGEDDVSGESRRDGDGVQGTSGQPDGRPTLGVVA